MFYISRSYRYIRITIYIIIYKNNQVSDKILASFHTGITKELLIYVISHVPFIEPNILSNTYPRVSPLKREDIELILQDNCFK